MEADMGHVMTQAEYESAKHHDYAGRNPDGTHWALIWTEHGTTLTPAAILDERDSAILERRVSLLSADSGPRVGDYVRFADRVERRASYITPADWLPDIDSVQTSDGGSWYLGEGYANFSGGLFPGVSRETLRLTEERKPGRVWFFHHDYWTAHNGVDALVMFRVYNCSEPAPR